ncbi:hypothetical protein P9869_02015 [Streptomyces ossamyceticus]|nr:hypothetical protein [Streptomyces ossamyceticus]
MTESETAAAVTREPSRFPAADATADVRTPALEAAGTATGAEAEAGTTAVCGSGSGSGCDGRCDCGHGYCHDRSCGCGGETVTLPRRRPAEAAHTLACHHAVVEASSR